MNSAAKQRIAGIICVGGAFVMVICISRMIPYGLAGDTHKLKVWFVPVAVAFLVSVPFGVAYYYYRSRVQTDKITERSRAEVHILSSVGQGSIRPTPTTPEPEQPKEKIQENK